MGRRESRDAAVKFLFAYDFTENKNTDIESLLEEFLAEYDGCAPKLLEREYVFEVASGTVRNLPEIDALIGKYASNWTLDRMAKMDIAILRVAVYELLNRMDIPDSVTINEAVELAKTYSHEDAGTFVNGILGSIYREKTPEMRK